MGQREAVWRSGGQAVGCAEAEISRDGGASDAGIDSSGADRLTAPSLGSGQAYRPTACRISRTAVASPTNTARLTIEWPMFSSSISGMAATAPTFA